MSVNYISLRSSTVYVKMATALHCTGHWPGSKCPGVLKPTPAGQKGIVKSMVSNITP